MWKKENSFWTINFSLYPLNSTVHGEVIWSFPDTRPSWLCPPTGAPPLVFTWLPHKHQTPTALVPGFDELYSANNHSCGGRSQEMHPKVSCCNSLCSVENNISIHELSSLPRGKCIASWRKMKYFTSSVEGKESGFNAVPEAAIVLGQTVQLKPGPTHWQKKLFFHLKKKEILVNFFSFLLNTLHLSEQ